jgi:prepilin-type N-terminal cleavage/methylation domain-containing protein/prepilin-type processing-associated H-X9-DG protein
MIRHRMRTGFTLIELLVVIAVIAILISLLVPAVQKVREAAARTQCQNNLKQIGIALHNYSTQRGRFPAGGDPWPWGASLDFTCLAHLLPFIEQQNLYDQINFSALAYGPFNAGVRAMPIPTFTCPSDPISTMPPGLGGNNYFANYGTNIPYFRDSTIANGPFCFETKGLRVTAIIDGTSNTAAFSEMAKGDFNNSIYSKPDILWPHGSTPTTADEALAICQSIDPFDLSYQWFSAGPDWISTKYINVYLHVGPPNARNCGFPDNLTGGWNANSYHINGVNVLMCDGSVRFVDQSIDLFLWRALGTRNGREPFNLID